MCSWFPVLEKFCFRFDLRTGLYAIAALRHTSFFYSMPATFSDSRPVLYAVHGRVKPLLRGSNSTEPNLFRHGETTCLRVLQACFRKRMSALRTFIWFVFIIVAVANYASRERDSEEKLPQVEVFASNVTVADVFPIEKETAAEAGEIHEGSSENVKKGDGEM